MGWLGLSAFIWATLGLPALHAIEHAREAEAHEQAHTHDVHELLREALAGRSGGHTHGHHHHHDPDGGHSGDPGGPAVPDPSHGHGSAQHFSLAVLAAAPPRLPPRATAFETLPPSSPAASPAWRDARSPRSSRGPPPARAA